MNYSKYRFTLDIHKTKSQVSIPILYRDTNVRFYMSINDGGTPYQIAAGCTAKLVGKQPNNDLFYHDCEIEDNRIVYTFNDDTASVLGVTFCEVRIYGPSGNVLTSPRFYMVVEEKVLSDEEVENIEPEDIAMSDMNYSKYRFTLDIHKNKSQVSIPVMLGDTSVRFYMSINDGGSPYQLAEGCTAKFAGKKPDGTIFFHDCEIEDNRIVYTFRRSTASVKGITDCEVRIYGRTEGVLTTPRFFMAVEEKVLLDEEIEDFIDSDPDLSGLDSIILVEQGRVAAEEARDNAEQERANAEQGRVLSEAERATAEVERKALYQELKEAKENGAFDGEDGKDYILTDEDKEEIAGMVDATNFVTDHTLSLIEGVLSVNTAKSTLENNTLPITAAAVHTQLGNIDALLNTI